MHKNQPSLYTNNLSNHASLLLSASPTIINSPLQNNTNNPQSSPQQPSSVAHVRRQPSTPLLATVANLDNDIYMNADSPPINKSTEGYINFKKPQNEIFKRLDGTIQKIVAAHSNLNKLYALNDFSSLGVGPKRPFELPPQLPPPPPWVPKVNADYCGQWNDETIEPLELSKTSKRESMSSFESDSNIITARTAKDATLSQNCPNTPKITKTSSLIDSAISKLHQKHNIERMLNIKGIVVADSQYTTPNDPQPPSSSASTVSPSSARLTPAQFDLLVRNIRDTFEQQKHEGVNSSREDSRNKETYLQNVRTDLHNKKADDIVDLLKKEIAAVTKSIGFNFSPVPKRSKPSDEKSLLLKSSPQTLYNTIRRETSLLLNRREPAANRSSLSLLSAEPFNRQNAHQNLYSNTNRCQQMNKLQHTVKVVVPPSEFHQLPKNENKETSSSENLYSERNRSDHSSKKESLLSKKPPLTYQVIKNKIRLFQETNKVHIGKATRLPHDFSMLRTNAWPVKKKFGQKTELDKIVDRLQAECSKNDVSSDTKYNNNLRRKLMATSTNLLQASSNTASISAPTPIPVFRSPLSVSSKGGYVYACSTGATKIVSMKSKKSKRLHHFGLRLGNYLDKECPQPSAEKITIEQFAKCLDLVRTNDVSLQKRQEQLLQSESRWRIPSGNRPLRLRRPRGERLHMPASSSYKATRKVGLQ